MKLEDGEECCSFECEEMCVYTNCANPLCGHYACEHILPGTVMSVTYDKHNPENVGRTFEPEVGCMNPCSCVEFVLPWRI